MISSALRHLSQQEQLNFLLTNRIPRQALTRLMGRYSRIENRWLARASIGLWRMFTDLDLSDAETTEFDSVHACFTRKLKPGARTIDARAHVVASPCDAIVGECGKVAGTTVYQAKGFPYELADLIPDPHLREPYRNGRYVTLRLTSAMYHRFHAPVDTTVPTIDYLSGDTWNVNPIALKRIEKLFCRNERAVLPLGGLAAGRSLCLVPVAAVLVASMRFVGIGTDLDLSYRGPNRIAWNRRFAKGEEMGGFQHGSTILVFASDHYDLAPGISAGTRIRMGQALLTDPSLATAPEAP